MTLNRHTHLNAIHSFKGEIYALKRKEGGLEFYFRATTEVDWTRDERTPRVD